MNQITERLENLRSAQESLKNLRAQREDIGRQMDKTENDIKRQFDQSLLWIARTLDRHASPDDRRPRSYVYQRLPAGSVYEPDMLKPIVGFWIKPPENDGVLVCNSIRFLELRNVTPRRGHPHVYDADIKRHYDFSESSAVSTDSAVDGVIEAVSTLQKALPE